MLKSSLPLFLLVVGVSSAPAFAATGAVVSVDFVGSGTPMASSESAGVVARANWNEATGASVVSKASAARRGSDAGLRLPPPHWADTEKWQAPPVGKSTHSVPGQPGPTSYHTAV